MSSLAPDADLINQQGYTCDFKKGKHDASSPLEKHEWTW